jgi:hypothetical protein
MHPQLTAVIANDHIASLRREIGRSRGARGPSTRLWRYLRDARETEQPEIHRTGGRAR